MVPPSERLFSLKQKIIRFGKDMKDSESLCGLGENV